MINETSAYFRSVFQKAGLSYIVYVTYRLVQLEFGDAVKIDAVHAFVARCYLKSQCSIEERSLL